MVAVRARERESERFRADDNSDNRISQAFNRLVIELTFVFVCRQIITRSIEAI